MPTVAESHISAFRALHILSRGTDLKPLAYLSAFERWMRADRGYACEWAPSQGRHFVRETAGGREVLEGHLTELPLKDYLRSFLEIWPVREPHDEVLSIMGRGDVHTSHLTELPVRMILNGTGVRGVLLISLEECEPRLLNELRAGAIKVAGLPSLVLEDPLRDYVSIPPTAFVGTPLLDWIAGGLGRHDRRRAGGQHFFPDPPIYTDLQFERQAVEALRAQLVEEKRQAFLAQYRDPDVREAMKAVWLASEEPAGTSSPSGPPPASVYLGGVGNDLSPEDAAPLPVPPRSKSHQRMEHIKRAEIVFCEMFARNGEAVSERRTYREIYEYLKSIFPDLRDYQFRKHVWEVHAPQTWKERGRIAEEINP